MTKGVYEAKRLRIGMYQRYRGGNMDEGWTRWLFEQWGFPFTQVYDAEIQKGNLNAKYDVFIFADDSTGAITGEPGGGRGEGRGGMAFASVPNTTPPEYRSGIGSEGVNAIRDFVQKGGTLVTLGGATDFAITRLGLPVRNVVAGLDSKEFFCPGSTLRVRVDNTHPAGVRHAVGGVWCCSTTARPSTWSPPTSTTATRSSSATRTGTSSAAAG